MKGSRERLMLPAHDTPRTRMAVLGRVYRRVDLKKSSLGALYGMSTTLPHVNSISSVSPVRGVRIAKTTWPAGIVIGCRPTAVWALNSRFTSHRTRVAGVVADFWGDSVPGGELAARRRLIFSVTAWLIKRLRETPSRLARRIARRFKEAARRRGKLRYCLFLLSFTKC